MAKYRLEVYGPGSLKDVWASVDSDEPFLSIQAGDILNNFTGQEFGEGTKHILPNFNDPASELRVTQLEHVIWLSGDGTLRHKIMAYTEEAANRRT